MRTDRAEREPVMTPEGGEQLAACMRNPLEAGLAAAALQEQTLLLITQSRIFGVH